MMKQESRYNTYISSNATNQKKWVKYFANELGRLAQVVGDRVKFTNTIFILAHNKNPIERIKDAAYGHFFFAITYPISMNHTEQYLWQEETSPVFQVASVP